jgi:hypothetical protein
MGSDCQRELKDGDAGEADGGHHRCHAGNMIAR